MDLSVQRLRFSSGLSDWKRALGKYCIITYNFGVGTRKKESGQSFSDVYITWSSGFGGSPRDSTVVPFYYGAYGWGIGARRVYISV